MSKKLFKRILPDPERLKKNGFIRLMGTFILNPCYWHLNRRSVAMAFLIGVFAAFLPMPFQMVLVAILALLLRANLPIAVSLVWITNPITMPIIFFFTYKIGCYILQTPVNPEGFSFSIEWLTSELSRIWLPLYVGSVATGAVAGILSYFTIRILWRINTIVNWQQRKKKLLEKKLKH